MNSLYLHGQWQDLRVDVGCELDLKAWSLVTEMEMLPSNNNKRCITGFTLSIISFPCESNAKVVFWKQNQAAGDSLFTYFKPKGIENLRGNGRNEH